MTLLSNKDGAAETNNKPLTEDSAAEEMLRRLLPPDASTKKPSKVASEPKPEAEDDEDTETDVDADEPDESPDDAGDDEDKGEEETEEKGERKHADEGAYVKIKVGDEEHEVPVKDLKRLYGQESALTKRSQEVANRRTAVDGEAAKYGAALQAMLSRANERAKPFEGLDFLSLSRNQDISDEELTALRAEAHRAHEEVQFLNSELGAFMTEIQSRQQSDLVERAKASIKELTDPEKGIPGWNEKLYDDVRSFALTAGAPKEVVNNLVDPWALRVLHKAMMFDRGKSKVVTTRVNKTPKRVVKTSTSPAVRAPSKGKVAEKMDRLRQSGTTDDAAAVFLTRLTAGRDD